MLELWNLHLLKKDGEKEGDKGEREERGRGGEEGKSYYCYLSYSNILLITSIHELSKLLKLSDLSELSKLLELFESSYYPNNSDISVSKLNCGGVRAFWISVQYPIRNTDLLASSENGRTYATPNTTERERA